MCPTYRNHFLSIKGVSYGHEQLHRCFHSFPQFACKNSFFFPSKIQSNSLRHTTSSVSSACVLLLAFHEFSDVVDAYIGASLDCLKSVETHMRRKHSVFQIKQLVFPAWRFVLENVETCREDSA